MSPQQPTTNLPPSIRATLDSVRRLLRAYLWRRWLWMVICWWLLVFWLGAAMDYLPIRVGSSETPKWVRIGLLASMAGGAVWLFAGWLLPRLLTRVRDSSLALLIERKYPHLNSELVTAVELTANRKRPRGTDDGMDAHLRAGLPTDAHGEMVARVLSQAERSVEQVVPEELFHWRPVRWLRTAAIAGALAMLAVSVLQWDWLNLWSRRLFLLSDQPWPRQAVLRTDFLQLQLPPFTGQLAAEQSRIEFKDGKAFIPNGASLLLQVSADASAPRVPEVCTLYYRSDDGTRGRANLRRIGAPVEGWQQFNLDGPPLDGLAYDLTLDIVGLDARLRDLDLEVVPRILVTDMKLDCVYPSYLLDSLSSRPSRESLQYRSGLKIPEGTDCTLVGQCNAPLSKVQFTRRTTSGDSEAIAEEMEILEATVNDHEFQIPLGRLRASELIELRLADEHGLPSEQVLRYHVVVVPDAIPEVQSRLEGIGLAMTPRAYLPIRGKVTDDYAVADVVAEVSVDEHPLRPIPLTLDDTTLSGNIDFQELAERRIAGLRPGMTVGLSVLATDHFDLDGAPHAGRGQPVQLAVVTEDQLLVLLDRQELELRQRLEQIISELSQLQEAIRGLIEQFEGLEATAGAGQGGRFSVVRFQSEDDSEAEDNKVRADDEKQKQSERQAMQRMMLLRAQQSQLQADKSRQELAGIANRVEHLRLQLAHNRMDSLDRQQRLLERVQIPLNATLAGEYNQLDKSISELVSQTMSGQGKPPAIAAATSLTKILAELEAIKANMLDIESFNELIDLVRGLLDQQEQVLKETEETQKARVLELFK